MKKIVFALCALLVFSCSAYLSYQAGIQKGMESGYNKGYAEGIEVGKETGYNEGYAAGCSQAKKDEESAPENPVLAALTRNQNATVYITDTGNKYHRNGCQYLHSSKTAITRSAAISRGYSACSVCW